MVSLKFDPDAEDELDALYEADADSAALIDVLLEQLEETPNLLDGLRIEKGTSIEGLHFKSNGFRNYGERNTPFIF